MAANSQPPIEELTRLYFDKGLTLREVGEATGRSPQSVHKRLKRAGYKLRPGNNMLTAPTKRLAELYFDEELTLREVGKRVGMTGEGVWRRLRAAGYKLRTDASWQKRVDVQCMDVLIDGYVKKQLPLEELCERTGLSYGVVRERLLEAGVTLRLPGHKWKETFSELKRKSAERDRIQEQLRSVEAEVQQLQAEGQGQDAKIAKMVDGAIPKFERLFSVPEVKSNPRLLLRIHAYPDLTLDELQSAREAINSHKPARQWPTIAARWLVALTCHYSVTTVRRYHNRAAGQ